MKLMPLYREPIWWAWLVTVSLIGAGLSGHAWGFHAAIVASAAQIVWLALKDRSLTSFPVQVRVAYTLCLLLYELAGARGWYWFTAAGTTAFLLFGYCFLARMLSLMPWNLQDRLTPALVKRTFLSAPTRGNVRQGMPGGGTNVCLLEARAGQMGGAGS